MSMLDVDGAALYYEVHGEGPGILGIHGTPSSALLWTDAARRLAEAGRCVVYDRRGFGRSSPPASRLDLADHVADAVRLIDRVVGVPAVVIGRSTGGLIALALAVAHPGRVRGLVLLEPAVFAIDDEAAAWAAGVRGAVLRAEPGRASEVTFRVALGDDAWTALPPEIAGHLEAASPAVRAEMDGDRLDMSASPYNPSDDQLRAVDRPTLLVSGEESPVALHRVNHRLAELLPQARLLEVPGGHLIDPAGAAVLDFVRPLLPAAQV